MRFVFWFCSFDVCDARLQREAGLPCFYLLVNTLICMFGLCENVVVRLNQLEKCTPIEILKLRRL